MSEHYYNIVNGRKTYSAGVGKPPIFLQAILDNESMSEDAFLYSRCAALVNGKAYFNAIKKGKRKINTKLEFEALLYVPAEAWAIAHHTVMYAPYDSMVREIRR